MVVCGGCVDVGVGVCVCVCVCGCVGVCVGVWVCVCAWFLNEAQTVTISHFLPFPQLNYLFMTLKPSFPPSLPSLAS